MDYTSNSSIYEDSSLDSPGNMYHKIRKITDINEMANFIMDHHRNIPKYVDVICETLDKIVSDSEKHLLHIEMVKVLMYDALSYLKFVENPTIPETCDSYPNCDNETNYLAYIKVLSVYAEWLFRGASKPMECATCGDNSMNRYRIKSGLDKYSTGCRMHTLSKRTLIPMLLLMTSPKTIDDYCELADPTAKSDILQLICGHSSFIDVEVGINNLDGTIDEFASILPSVSMIVGTQIVNYEEEMIDKINLIIKQNYINPTDDTYCVIRGAILNYIRIIRGIFTELDDRNKVYNSGTLLYDAKVEFDQGMRRDMAEALGSKYYGDDAYIIFKEVPYIYYNNSLNPDGDSWKEEAEMTSSRLVTFAKMLSNVYNTSDKINETYIRAALHNIHDERKDYQDYVMKEYDKKCKSGSEMDEDIAREIASHRWIFFDDSEEEIEEDDTAIESKISRRARRTVRRDKALNKAYNKFHELDTRVNKADSTLTKWAHGLKNLIMGDTRTEVIEGKNYTVLGIFRRLFTDAAIWSFFGPVKGILALLVKYALKKKTTNKERKAIIRELDSEIEICEAKIQHAAEDGKMHRKDVYRLMRIKEELKNARDRIKDETGVSYRTAWYVKDTLNKRGGVFK